MSEVRRRLRIASWNAKVGRGPRTAAKGLAELIRDLNPDVIALQECKDYVRWFRIRFPLWRVYAKAGWPDSMHSPIMVRRRLRRGRRYGKGWGTVRVEKGWVYHETGKAKPGRTWTWVRVEGIHILSLHRIPGKRGNNVLSYNEEADRLIDWISEHDQVVVIGDANESPHAKGPEAMSRIAHDTQSTLRYDPMNPGIDYALVHGLLAGILRRKNAYGSDHRATRMTVVKPYVSRIVKK